MNLSKDEQQVSITALWANILRAMANKERPPALRGPDDQAVIFIPPFKRMLLNFGFMRALIRRKLSPGVYEYVLARTFHFDRLFAQALKEGIAQIVVLGAGLDTRAIRFGSSIGPTRIFELDVSATQEYKRRVLRNSGIVLSEQVSFVRGDLNSDGMEDALNRAGYLSNQKSLFVLEGVTMYLSEDAVGKLLDFIQNSSGPGSTVLFDYFYRSVVEGRSEEFGAREQYEAVLKLGEPFNFGIDAGNLDTFLREHGFLILSHYGPEQFEKAYLYDDHDQLYGRMYRCGGVAHAESQA